MRASHIQTLFEKYNLKEWRLPEEHPGSQEDAFALWTELGHVFKGHIIKGMFIHMFMVSCAK